LLVANLERLDESQEEDKQAVHNTLGIFENLMEVAPEVASTKITQDTKLLEWVLKRLRKGKFDENQLYTSEILSMLLINGGHAVKAFTSLGGLKRLVRCVAGYRKRDPDSLDEVEFVENLFNCICSTLTNNKSEQDSFAAADGLQLMVTMVRKKRYTLAAALKVLNYAILNSPANCQKLIDASGLKAVFKAFMGRGKTSKKLKKELEATEEHILIIIVQLFTNLSDIRYLRLLNKFRENGYEKIERLVELHEKYFARLEASEKEWKDSHPDQEEDEDERYLRRLDSGLYCLQLCALIIALVASAGEKGILDRLEQLLNQQDSSLKDVQETLQEYHFNLSENDEFTKKQKLVVKNIMMMVDRINGVEPEPEFKAPMPKPSKAPVPEFKDKKDEDETSGSL